ncbi:hypothetical protein EJB05_00068, partial [Eragrostis curvula]
MARVSQTLVVLCSCLLVAGGHLAAASKSFGGGRRVPGHVRLHRGPKNLGAQIVQVVASKWSGMALAAARTVERRERRACSSRWRPPRQTQGNR